MKKPYIFILVFFVSAQAFAQLPFARVYTQVTTVPAGLLEAVAYTQTRMQHLTPAEPEGCSGIPRAYGLMGLTLDGKNYFNENLGRVSVLSGIPEADIIQDPYLNVLAYAKAFESIWNESVTVGDGRAPAPDWHKTALVLGQLSEIPDTGYVHGFARDCQLYAIFSFLNDPAMAANYHFPVYNINLDQFFGHDRYQVLSSPKITFAATGIMGNGIAYPQPLQLRSTQYGPAIWNPAPSCNYSSRAGTAVSAITIHTVQGTYAGAISWSQNCASSVSFHYVLRSSDGQVTQMVDESIKAWHVGSENPYTIGYEHEGYVSSPVWYTSAMYASSASLSRDICASGYGISPLRTYYGASSGSTVTLGGCTKIKGHQHYPMQTHTDPGIYWDWKHYYHLINNAPVVTTLTAATGGFYDSGGAGGNYANDERKLTLIQPSGATSVSLTFTQFDLEANWDYMFIYDGSTVSAPLIGTYTGTAGPGTVTATGGSLLIEFRSDCATTRPGWAASYTSSSTPPIPVDNVAPTTAITVPSAWASADFTATYTDADNAGGSGIEKSFYQVIDFDGTDWRANAARGFFSENFDLPVLHPDWTIATGTWGVTGNILTQSDESLANTNVYAYLNHSLSNRYLYHWAGKMEGTGTNRRAGFHYFCDAPGLTNRGNSYFVWFRLDGDAIEIYKVTSDVFSLVASAPYNFNAAQWYDYKVTYDRITGKTQVFVDNTLSLTWTDAAPYASGNYISFRSGNASWAVNNLKVYRSRAASTLVTVGPAGDLRYQNNDPVSPAGRIKTIVNDNAGNISSLATIDINVDTTAPSAPLLLTDGDTLDMDTWTSVNHATAYWQPATDAHSGIATYWYALGTTPGGTDVVGWTDNSWYDSTTITGLSLALGQTYYFAVKAENAAGLVSAISVSDGFTIIPPTNAPDAGFHVVNSSVCAGQCIQFTNTSGDATAFSWSFTGGDIASSALADPVVCYPASGTYPVTLIASGPGGTDTLTQVINVDVYDMPVAAFGASADTVFMPSAFAGFTNASVNANGYYWDFGDGVTSTNPDPWHVYAAAGTYIVSMIAANGPCANDTAYMTITVLNITGLPEAALPALSIFPNPVTGLLFIHVKNNTFPYEVKLMNGLGQPVLVKTLNRDQPLDLSPFPNGLYHIQVNINGQVYTQPLVKQ